MAEANQFPPSSDHVQFANANIYRCLAPCKECTGNYVSKILKKRLTCHCPCHHHDRLSRQRKEDVEYYAEGEDSTKKGDKEEV